MAAASGVGAVTPQEAFPMGAGKGAHYVALPETKDHGVVTGHALETILVEPQALYALWKEVESFPRWQEFVVSVTPKDEKVSHWVMGDPTNESGSRVEFDSEITEDIAGEKIAWRSISGLVHQVGEVRFEKTSRGTRVRLIQTVKVPGGQLGNAFAAMAARSPQQIVIENLRHFKQLAESGEIPSVEGQPHGPRGASGAVKSWMYGETNPTPPGTSSEA